jgi:hypothetical protein
MGERAKTYSYRLLIPLIAGLLAGCASGGKARVLMTPDALAAGIVALGPAVDPTEAKKIAALAYERASELGTEYRVVPPPQLHNALVHLGLRKRGVCWQWADDLEKTLFRLNLRTLALYECAAYPGSFRRHYALVVSPREQGYESGIVLDAWRGCGRVWWCPVKEDSYPWQLRPRK